MPGMNLHLSERQHRAPRLQANMHPTTATSSELERAVRHVVRAGSHSILRLALPA
jgi:hypothetical protein